MLLTVNNVFLVFSAYLAFELSPINIQITGISFATKLLNNFQSAQFISIKLTF